MYSVPTISHFEVKNSKAEPNFTNRAIICGVVGLCECIISVTAFVHFLGLIFGFTLFISALWIHYFQTREPTVTKFFMLTSQKDGDAKNKNWSTWILLSVNSLHIWITLLLLIIGVSNIWIERNIVQFPNTCSPQPGCARVARDFNHRDDLVDKNDVITFSGLKMQDVRLALVQWIQTEFDGTIVFNNSPAESKRNTGLNKNEVTKSNNILIHTLYVSYFFGFVDDMLLQVVDCNKDGAKISVEVQSVLRIGVGDLEVNPRRVANMYSCLASSFDKNHTSSSGKVC
jgi:hypothetical protein